MMFRATAQKLAAGFLAALIVSCAAYAGSEPSLSTIGGSKIKVMKDILIMPGRYAVYFQKGVQVEESDLNRGLPYCWIKMYDQSTSPRVIKGGKRTIELLENTRSYASQDYSEIELLTGGPGENSIHSIGCATKSHEPTKGDFLRAFKSHFLVVPVPIKEASLDTPTSSESSGKGKIAI